MSQEEIVSLLKRKGPMKARELSDELHISYPTVCRSIRKLEMNSEVVRNVSEDGLERTYYITE